MTSAQNIRPAERPYHVWRRRDGYVSVSKGHAPRPPEFDVLLTTHDWPEARACTEANRDERHRRLVASWSAEGMEQ